MNHEHVVIRARRSRPGTWGAPLWAVVLLVGCGDDAPVPVLQETAPAVSLAVPVLETAPADMHALVPADSVIFVQAVSLEALKDASNSYLRLIDPAMVTNDPREWLTGLGLFDPSRVDFERPCGLAVSVAAGEFPITFIFGSDDPGALSRTAAPGIFVATQGDYAAFSPSGEPGAVGSPLTADLPVGSMAGRLDLPPLVEATRLPLELGLGLIQAQVIAQPSATGIDMQAFMASVADMIRVFTADVDSLEFAIGQDGRPVELHAVLTVKDGSPLGGIPAPTAGNLRDIASRVDADSPMLVLMRADINSIMSRSHDLMRSMIGVYYPEGGESPDLDEVMGGFSALYRLGAGTMAGSFSFGGNYMGWTVFESSNPTAFVHAHAQLVEDGIMNMGFSKMVETESTGAVGGVPVVSFRTSTDLDRLYEEIPDPRAREQMQEMMRQMNGGHEDMISHVLHAGDYVGMIMGARDTTADAALASALSGPAGELEPDISMLVDQLDSHDAGFAMRIDILAYMRTIMAMMGPTMSEGSVAHMPSFDGSAMMVLVAAVKGNDWDLSLSLDLGGLFESIPPR